MRLHGLLLAAAMLALSPVSATAQIAIDATAPASPPETGYLKQGTHVSPSGRTVTVNSRYLSIDGVPHLPVMGEFHFSRYPEDRWEEELLKMKAAGIDIVASYVIWIHHEEEKGVFDWS